MDKELVAHFVEHVELADGGECDVSSAVGMLRMELLVHERLIQLGRKAVQDLTAEVGTGYQGPRMKRGRVVFRLKGNRPQGRCTGCMDRSRCSVPITPAIAARPGCPWMSGWGSRTGQTPACEYQLAQFAGLGPYQRSLSHFHTIFRPAGVDTISLHKSECMVDALGARLERQRQQEIEELFRHAGSVRGRR